MNYRNVTDPTSVMKAVKEYDRLGREDFLAAYKFGKALNYFLVVDEKSYDSKAILAVAHKFQFGSALKSRDFRGGADSVAPHLRSLGFIVPAPKDSKERNATRKPNTFIVLWNPDEWPWTTETRARCQSEINSTGVFFEQWTLGSRTGGIEEGDRFFLLKVGALPRGIIASGTSIAPALSSNTSIPRANIGWDTLLDTDSLLSKETLRREIPEKNWTIPGGGILLPDSVAQKVEKLWAQHIASGSKMADDEIERRYAKRLAKHRIHQEEFRALLINSTKHPKCFVCGFDEVKLLEAAHIVPDSQGGKSNRANGRLFCLNHHKAHDRGMFRLVNDKPVWSPESQPFGAPKKL